MTGSVIAPVYLVLFLGQGATAIPMVDLATCVEKGADFTYERAIIHKKSEGSASRTTNENPVRYFTCIKTGY